jgi:uncharacterized membrane protein
MPEDKEIQDAKIFAVIGYLSILCIIPLVLKKENKFALFHGKQGLVLFIIEVAAFIFMVIPFIGPILARIVFFLCGVASLWGIIQALLGNYTRIPLISELADKVTL